MFIFTDFITFYLQLLYFNFSESKFFFYFHLNQALVEVASEPTTEKPILVLGINHLSYFGIMLEHVLAKIISRNNRLIYL